MLHIKIVQNNDDVNICNLCAFHAPFVNEMKSSPFLPERSLIFYFIPANLQKGDDVPDEREREHIRKTRASDDDDTRGTGVVVAEQKGVATQRANIGWTEPGKTLKYLPHHFTMNYRVNLRNVTYHGAVVFFA